jgi:hypothetical protein
VKKTFWSFSGTVESYFQKVTHFFEDFSWSSPKVSIRWNNEGFLWRLFIWNIKILDNCRKRQKEHIRNQRITSLKSFLKWMGFNSSICAPYVKITFPSSLPFWNHIWLLYYMKWAIMEPINLFFCACHTLIWPIFPKG